MKSEKLYLTLSALEELVHECELALDAYDNQPDHVAMYLLGCLGILQDDLAFVMRTKGKAPAQPR